ncbi:unnamed protein product [Caenorhabditis auriculariae]|uniref:UDP-glucose:glycoprotein glucosyltransferase n=1 Tax=Caenorhabditis auriculariae TaxID=2777116 RepID=A0A8S1H1F1_9PELO|nr:unnamed protein product [Caenorhabditis auriculariae]
MLIIKKLSLITLAVGFAYGQSQPKAVFASLNAKWNATSLLSEASDALYWKFVDTVTKASSSIDLESLTEEKKYEFIIKQSAKLLNPSTIDLLKFSLGLRQYSPTVQLFQQIGSEYGEIKCRAFFVAHELTGCTVDELNEVFKKDDLKGPETILSADHVYPLGKTSPVTVVVYGEIGNTDFAKLFAAATSLAKANKIKLVHRPFSRRLSANQVSLSGYGVELAIKNTEYKAEDDSNKKQEEEPEEENLHGFNFKLLKKLHSDVAESLDSFRMHLKEVDELAPLKNWQVQDLSYQAAQKILNEDSDNALAMLTQLSQNFPLHARSLSRVAVNNKMRKEVEANQNSLQEIGVDAGECALFLNGINFDVDSLDLFQLVETLKQEDKLATGFYNLGVNREYLSVLVGLDMSDEKITYAVDYRDAYPFFINNLDTDKRYKQWGNSVRLMLQPYYPGMIRPIARNLFTLVFVVDPTEKESRNLMKIAHSFFRHEVPLRIGIVFAVNADKEVSGLDDAGVALLNIFNYFSIDSSNEEALKIVNEFLDIFRDTTFTVEDVKKYFTKRNSDLSFEDVCGPKSDYDNGRSAGAQFLKRSGLNKAPKVLLNGYPLEDAGIKGDSIEEAVMTEVMKITPKIQKAVMEGRLQDRGNVANWLLDQKDVMPKINDRILNAPSEKRYVDLFSGKQCEAKTLTQFNALTAEDKGSCVMDKMKYVQKSTESDITTPITLWIAADLENKEGRELVYNSLQSLKSSSKIRIGLLMNPADEKKTCEGNSISSYVQAAFRLLPTSQAKALVSKLVKEEFARDFISGKLKFEEIAVGGMNIERFLKEKKLFTCDRIQMESKYLTEVVGLEIGQRAVIANGMIIGPLESGEGMDDSDFKLLEKLLISRGSETLAKHIDKWEVEKENGKSSDLVLSSFTLVGKYANAKKRTWVVLKNDKNSVVTLNSVDKDRAAMDVVAVVDPLTPSAQKLAPILEVIRKITNSDIKVVMNPKGKLSELPIKRFYRYVAPAEVQFDQKGEMSPNVVRFEGLPKKQLLTMSLHAPDSWMVEAVFAKYDLDNIKLEQVESDVVAVFSLEHLLLEGQCFDEVSGQPPRGLQFVLGTPSNPSQFDTIVMANLGYFQLKATPGAWQLQLRDGRSKEIYQISSHVGTEPTKDQIVRVVIDSFSGKSIRVRVSKLPGMEDRNVLSDDGEDGIWSSLSSFVADREKNEKINVFSLASGHLYERFMRIMILSVMKNTKSPVKFWLLKNYLSPQFKESLPLMAEHYGFEYALVEYKWPRWLHNQKEKHRIMWGYKILFLDVLFPLDVSKIIFVDADQVVRSDLMELMKFDLGGAPYGYVPFCDSRKEMDGFRFWKQGYWANHLAGRRYHISALYVIDLQKFRQIAAGDRLRGQYQGLSSDPNSLSNLDQDLPNNMIHQVKIKSLPQEWLWCETWCDDSSKRSAKTIDLCNNPLTKEPKLDSAVRIIPEWKEYDEEVKSVIYGSDTASKNHEEL